MFQKGKLSMYQLGKTLKLRYQSFLNEYYSSKELSILSSYAPRCQMSAMTLLAGLYPPVGNQIWNKNLLWQPIPVNPIPRNIDNVSNIYSHFSDLKVLLLLHKYKLCNLTSFLFLGY